MRRRLPPTRPRSRHQSKNSIDRPGTHCWWNSSTAPEKPRRAPRTARPPPLPCRIPAPEDKQEPGGAVASEVGNLSDHRKVGPNCGSDRRQREGDPDPHDQHQKIQPPRGDNVLSAVLSDVPAVVERLILAGLDARHHGSLSMYQRPWRAAPPRTGPRTTPSSAGSSNRRSRTAGRDRPVGTNFIDRSSSHRGDQQLGDLDVRPLVSPPTL